MTEVTRRHLITATSVASLGAGGLLSTAKAQTRADLVIVLPLLIQQFDPTNQQAASDYLAHSLMFDGLLNLGPNGKYPGLATAWRISPDGLQVEFDLRQGVRFHNGDEFTAEDVKFTFERIIGPDSVHNGRRRFMTVLERVDVVNRHRVHLVLREPWADLLTSVRAAGTQFIVPRRYYEQVGPRGFQERPVGTGPFRFGELRRGEFTRFEVNTDYWQGTPGIRNIQVRLVPEAFTRLAMLGNGEADIAMDVTGPLLDRARQDPRLRIVMSRYSGTNILGFNRESNPEFRDRRARLAVAHAIDLETIGRQVLGGICEPATHHFTPATFGHNPNLSRIPYDPDRARRLLAEAGIRPGHQIDQMFHTQSFASQPNGPAVQEAIAGYLEAVGLRTRRIPRESGTWLETKRAGRQTGIFYGPSSVPDDGGGLLNDWYTPRAWCGAPCGQAEPTYDAVSRQVNRETDTDRRQAMLQEWAAQEREAVTMVPLFWCSTPFVIGPRVERWEPSASSGYHMNLHAAMLRR